MSIRWNATILVIEDYLSEFKLVSHSLSNRGYDIIKITGAKEALKIILEEKPLIIHAHLLVGAITHMRYRKTFI